MGRLKSKIRLFNKEELLQIHKASLALLSEPGMQFDEVEFLDALEKKGCNVDYEDMRAKFPKSLIEETLKSMKKDVDDFQPRAKAATGEKKYGRTFTGHGKYNIPGLPAVKLYDYEKKIIREGTERDALEIIQLGDALEDICSIATPLFYSVDLNGKSFDRELWAIKCAALLANNTSKAGIFELTNAVQIEYLLKIRCILDEREKPDRGSPMIQTFCYLISPLRLGNPGAGILLVNVKKGFPILIGNMPISGTNAPVTLAGNIALGNAEILGAVTACKAINPEAPYRGQGYVSAIMDMKSCNVSLGSPEVALQDMAMAELYDKLYGLGKQGTAPFETDAKAPGPQACIERAFLTFRTLASGSKDYIGGGYLYQGQVFSREQLILDLEMANWLERFSRGIEVNDDTLAVDLIRKMGSGGKFLDEEHTLTHYKQELWDPMVLDRSSMPEAGSLVDDEIYSRAHEKIKKIMRDYKPFQLNMEKSKKINEIVLQAEEEIPKILKKQGTR